MTLNPDFIQNFQWYTHNRSSLLETHKDMIGKLCIVHNQKIHFCDDSLTTLTKAFSFARSKGYDNSYVVKLGHELNSGQPTKQY